MRKSEINTDFEIIFRGSFLHVLHTENYEITPEGMVKLWLALSEACQTYKCYKVLSEGRIYQRKLKGWDAYNSGSQAGEIRDLQMACLFYNYEPDETTEFFKTISANRGSQIEFFTDKVEALKWLGIDKGEKTANFTTLVK